MEILVYGIPAVLLIMGITQLAKIYIGERWIPLFAVVFGAILVVAANSNNLTDTSAVIGYIIQGIVVGLTACGLYSGTKATAGK